MQFGRTIRALALASALSAGATDAAIAEGKPLGVIELFTSQGCSSCPPADAYFNELTKQGDVIALAYHVDYWDYLGWRDTLARPQNTERQYAYMRALGERDVYTPQIIVNGREHLKGADKARIREDLAQDARAGNGLHVSLSASESEDSVAISAGGGDVAADANLVLIYYDAPQSIAIDRGENDGRTVTYINAVREVRIAGMWHGEAITYELPKTEFSGKGGCVALLQRMGKDGAPGPILGAVIVRNP